MLKDAPVKFPEIEMQQKYFEKIIRCDFGVVQERCPMTHQLFCSVLGKCPATNHLKHPMYKSVPQQFTP